MYQIEQTIDRKVLVNLVKWPFLPPTTRGKLISCEYQYASDLLYRHMCFDYHFTNTPVFIECLSFLCGEGRGKGQGARGKGRTNDV